MPLSLRRLVPKKKLFFDKFGCLLSQNCSGNNAVKLGRNTFLHWDYNLTKNNLILRGSGWECLFSVLISCGTTLLCNEPLLQYPDASADGIGGVLSQGKIGKDLPISYASRVLTKADKKYSTIERELTSIVWSFNQFRPYVWGRKFTIVTDHKPLLWVFKMNDPRFRIMTLKLKLQEFEYVIIFKKGNENSNSDGLSRMYTVAKGNIVREGRSEERKRVSAKV
jgi:hypothetical protein